MAGASESDLERAARGSIYARAGMIMLRYFNYGHRQEIQELRDISKQARRWCMDYFQVPSFNNIPLHSHPKISRLYGTGTEPMSHKLEEDESDNPWLLFHPDAFNTSVVPWRRFIDERAETSRADTTSMKDFYQEPYSFGVLMAGCITARKLNDADFKTATQHTEYSRALNRFKPQSDDFDGQFAITPDDLWRDEAIIRYMPELIVWLGHTLAQWAMVGVSEEQTVLYRSKSMSLSGKMFFGRAEKARLCQGGDGPMKYKKPSHSGKMGRLINKWYGRIATQAAL